MTDGAGLSGSTAALYGSNHVIDSSCAGQFQRLFNDNFKSFQVKVIIKYATIDYDISLSCYQTDSGNGCLSAACA